MKLKLFILLICLVSSDLLAQIIRTSRYSYQVLIDNPTAFVNNDPIDIGRYLEPGAVIEIDTGLVVLVNPNGQTLELEGPIKQEIPHQIIDFEDWNQSGFSHLLKSKLKEVEFEIAPTAFAENFSSVNLIGRPFYLSSFRVLKSDSIRLFWKNDTLNADWIVTLENVFSEKFYQTMVQDNHVSIPFGAFDEEFLVVSIAKIGERHKKSIGLVIIDPDSIPAITAVDHLILALRYEAQFDWKKSDFHFKLCDKLASDNLFQAILRHKQLRTTRKMEFNKRF